jgi:hypothetical protein
MGLERGSLLALVAASSLFLGCDDPTLSLLSFAVPTEVAVNPSDFLGDTSCSTNAGAMRSYVMTLSAFEDAEDATPFLIGSTQPTPCSLIAGFREVIVLGQSHIADVDGYDVPVELLEPFGGNSSGSRQMRHLETGDVVSPRWTSSCGAGAENGAIATSTRRVFVRPCTAIVDSAPTPTQLTIGPAQVLGEDACEVAASFDVAPEATGLAAASGVLCDAAPITYEVAPGASYDLYATATLAGVPYGSICTATAVRGVTVTAKCNPLSASGRANVALTDIVTGADEPLCPSGGFFDIIAGDDVLNGVPLPCLSSAQVGPLSAGLELLDVVIYDAAGIETGRGSCAADIAPGKTTSALCVSNN